MNKEMKELLHHIESVIWDIDETDHSKVASIQSLLYQWGQIQDKKTEDLFGSDQYPIHDDQSPYPNPRRM